MTTSKKQYPFLSKAQILETIAQDDDTMLECLQIMDGRQTSDERDSLTTKYKNRCGWMSSHAVNGGKLAKKAREEGLDSEEVSKARGMVLRYGRQLACHFREEAIHNDPSLAEVAKIFSAG